MAVSLLTVKDRVEDYLTRVPALRDDDNRLIAHIWEDEVLALNTHGKEGITMHGFLSYIRSGSLTSSESIVRCRRKFQEINPALRGLLWNSRHANEGNINNELGQF